MTEIKPQVQAVSIRQELADFVRRRISRWQRALSDEGDQSSHARALRELAELRRAPIDAMSTDFGTLLTTLEGMPAALVGRGDSPTRAERSAHATLVLYAVHQQSQPHAVHDGSRVDGQHMSSARSLGQAAGRLASGVEDGVVTRFKAVAGASTMEEALYHLQSFLGMLRTARPPIPLDYGQLAVDIYDLHDPEGRERVQLKWARAFHHVPDTTDDSAPLPATAVDALQPNTTGDPA